MICVEIHLPFVHIIHYRALFLNDETLPQYIVYWLVFKKGKELKIAAMSRKLFVYGFKDW